MATEFKTGALRPPKAPNLPNAPREGYNANYFDQYSNVLRLYFNQIDNFAQPFTSSAGGAYLKFPSASYQDNTQQNTSTTVGQPISWTQVDYANQFVLSDQTANFTGSRALTTLTVTAITSGYIHYGMHITGTGWQSAVCTASIGTVGGVNNVMTVTAVASGTLAVGQYLVDGTGLVTGARIAQLISGTGGTGTYLVNVPDNSVVTLASTTITAYGTYISAQLTGTPGGVGTYTVSTSGTIASTTLQGRNTSKLVAQFPGAYNFNFSAQLSSLSSASETVYIWLRKNGVDVDGSTGQVGLLARKGPTTPNTTITGWAYTLQLNAGDYVELFWLVSNLDVTMTSFPKNITPAYPATASAIVTVQFVSALY